MSAITNFVQKVHAAGVHVIHFVTGGGLKADVVKVEEVAVKVESWLGSNALAKQYLKPLTDKLVAGVEGLGQNALKDIGSGATLDQIVQHVEAGIPGLISQTKTDALAEIKAAVPDAHTSTVFGFIETLYMGIAPRLPQILGALLPK